MKHLGSLESTQEARVARGYASKLPVCFISRWTRAKIWTNCWWKIIIFFHVCWYSQSAAYTSLAFGATRSGWWMNSKAFTILNTNCLSELSQIMAAKTLKKSVSLADNKVYTFLEREENQYTKRKTESCVFSGFRVSISHVWEWKWTTGRFATGRFWPFTWNTFFCR